MQVAQRVGDREVALRVTEPDRRGDVERALRRDLPRVRAARAPGCDEIAQEQVDLHRVAHMRAVARAFEHHELGRRSASARRCAATARDLVFVAVDDEHRAANAVAEARRMASCAQIRRSRPSRRAFRRRLEAPAHAVLVGLVECGSVNMFAKKNSRKSSVVAAASSGGCTSASPRTVPSSSFKASTRAAREQVAERHRRADQDGPVTRSGCSAARSSERCAPIESDEHRALGCRRVHHRQRIGGEARLRVARPPAGPRARCRARRR